jgi:hypothetical protein
MSRPLRIITACLLTLIVALDVAGGHERCERVNGHFEAALVPPGEGHCPDDPGALCTAGRVRGGIQGTYQFVITGATPSATIGGTPTALFYTGKSTVLLKTGDELTGTDTGTLDPPPGHGGFASLITWDGGTGEMSGATGQIRLRGEFTDGGAGTAGDYVGALCTP